MKTIRILILEDDLKTLAVIMDEEKKLLSLEKKHIIRLWRKIRIKKKDF